jgi:hypothetical protein
MPYPVLNISTDLKRHPTKFPPFLNQANLVNVMVHNSGAENDIFTDAAWHVEGNDWWGVAYYKSIDYDGTVYVCRKRTEQGWHCRGGSMNWTALPICLRGNMELHAPTTDQVDSLINEIIKENFELGRRLNIVWHDDYVATLCPGKFMPRAEIVRRVNEYYTLPPDTEPTEPEPDEPEPTEPDPTKPDSNKDTWAMGTIALILSIIALLLAL